MNLSKKDENIELSLIRLRRQIALLDDKARKTTSAPGRGTMEAPAEHIYMIVDEITCWGAWTNPRNAARWYLEADDESSTKEDIDKMLKELLDTSDYPVLAKVIVNPTRHEEPWVLSR